MVTPRKCYHLQLTVLYDSRNVDREEKRMVKRADYDTTIVFTVLAITLFVVGLYLLIRIKNNFPHLHEEYRCYFWSALFVLTFPLLLRSIIDIAFDCWFEWPSEIFKEALFNDIFTLLTDYLPVVC